MSSPERARSDPKREKSVAEGDSGGEKRKQRPEKSKKSREGEHSIETGDETRKDRLAAEMKKKKRHEESALEKLSSLYGESREASSRNHRRRWDEESVKKDPKTISRSEEKRKQQRPPAPRDGEPFREDSGEKEKPGRRGRRRSPTPDRGGRRLREVETPEMEQGKRKEKPSQPECLEKEKPGGLNREWDGGSDRAHGRVGGGRKDWRNEAVKTSSNYGISNDNYDVIEIQTRSLDSPKDDFLTSFPENSEKDDSGSGGRGRAGAREGQQQIGVPLPVGLGSPFTPVGIPRPVFLPPFSPGVIWPGAPPRFPPWFGNIPGGSPMYLNDTGQGLGIGPGMGRGVMGRGVMGRGRSRGEQNDYSQNFVDTGMRPQNFIRELEMTNVVEDYPKLRELIQKKDEIVAKAASPPMYLKCDLHEIGLSSEFFGTKFDVVLVDPPWEEYVHRAPGAADHMSCWSFEEIMNLKIEAIADTPSFIFLWVGDGIGLQQGRQCLKKWGFRRCEDICWVKTNKTTATPGLRHDSRTLFQHSKEHCLMGIKGTVRRSTDGHIIHANIDTDVIIAEEPPYGSTAKPEDMYRIIEHFSLGRRRLELFGEDHNIRSGWLTVGDRLSSSNFNSEAFVRSFADKEGRVWQGGGGRNPPPESPHLVVTTPDIELLRPKSPMKNQLQIQQQPPSIPLITPLPPLKRTIGYPIYIPPIPSVVALDPVLPLPFLGQLAPPGVPDFGEDGGTRVSVL